MITALDYIKAHEEPIEAAIAKLVKQVSPSLKTRGYSNTVIQYSDDLKGALDVIGEKATDIFSENQWRLVYVCDHENNILRVSISIDKTQI